jgi:kynurenine formamidase
VEEGLSNWGRWDANDELGTLNLITAAKRREAAALVKDGVSVSLGRDADTEKAVDNPAPYEQKMLVVRTAVATDRIAVNFHGYAHTHLDALAHHFLDGKMYNGFSRDDNVTMEGGAKKGSVAAMQNGITTRGILVDVPLLRKVGFLEPGAAIGVTDLEAWERNANVKIGAGDAMLIRTGRWVRRRESGPWEVNLRAAGLDPSVIPWLRRRDVALLGSESALDAVPLPAGHQITNADDYLPVHNFVLVALGMPVIDNCDFDAVATAAAARRRWQFMLSVAPLRIGTGTGSPVNPLAMF